MADLSDVENTFKAMISAAIYPTGTADPSAITLNAAPVPVRIVRGWPVKNQLEADLAAGKATVSVYPMPGEKRTSRYPAEYSVRTDPVVTLTAIVDGDTITIGGTVISPQNVAALVGGAGYVYGVQPGDTLAGIASALAALINADTPASSAGPVITVTSPHANLVARVGGVGTLIRELRRQEKQFQISCWCSTPEQRDAVAIFVDGVLVGSGLERPRAFIVLPDTSAGRLLYERTLPTDKDQLSGAFRRDFVWSVEYPTTDTAPAAQITLIKEVVQPSVDEVDLGPALTYWW